jgi:heme/copper-type cytochrome/quinol oxidase subunit 2
MDGNQNKLLPFIAKTFYMFILDIVYVTIIVIGLLVIPLWKLSRKPVLV